MFMQYVVLFLSSQACYVDIYRILEIDIMIVCINQIGSFCVRHLFIWITFAVLVCKFFFFNDKCDEIMQTTVYTGVSYACRKKVI